jgi:hypothetical protein
MANVRFVAQTTEQALTAATALSVLQVIAPANQRVKVLGWGVYFDGIDPVAEPVQVRVTGGITAGTFTNLLGAPDANGSKTAVNGATETVQSLAKEPATVEPTVVLVYDIAEVHPQSGQTWFFPKGAEPIVAGGAFIAIECTAPAGVNVRAKLICEE